jgi:tetratricopeptide (TPR) repeat protein
MKPATGLLLAALVTGCAGPDRGDAYLRDFDAAQAAESAGRFADASARYDQAARGALVPRDRDHAVYLAARALARAGDRADAAERLRAIADATPPREDSAEAANALAEMQIDRGGDDGWTALLDVARRFPSSGVARPALRHYLAHEDEAHGAAATLDEAVRLAPSFAGTELDETVHYEIALHYAAVGDDARARDALLACATRWPYPRGAFWDDSLYRASLLDEKLGHVDAAIADLERMLLQREPSFLTGTYERPKYEPAMVRLCALYRDRLRDPARSRECFHRLYTDFTTSELRDDALWEEARLYREGGDGPTACARLGTLVRDFPDSRFVPCALSECSSIPRPAAKGAPAECHGYIAGVRLGRQD